MAPTYRVFASAEGLDADALYALAVQLAMEPDVEYSVDELTTGLTRGPLDVLRGATRARAEALRALLTAAGVHAELQAEQEKAGKLSAGIGPLPSFTSAPASPAGVSSTILGGFQAPSSLDDWQTASPAPSDPATNTGNETKDNELELLTLDEATDLAAAPAPVQLARTLPRAKVASAKNAPQVNAPRPLGLDALDASSLVMLDGSADDAPPPARAVRAPLGAEGSHHPDDPRFRPPEEAEPTSTTDATNASLELDVPPPRPKLPDAPPLEAAEPAGEALDDLASAAPEQPNDEPTELPPVATTRRRRAGNARRRRLSLVVARGLRENALLRVTLGFVLAVSLGSILPMCHARSVMSKTVHELRVELSTARAHGAYATPAFSSVQQIEEEIKSVKWRQGAWSLMLWLGGSGALLFLWFRFLGTPR